MVVVETNKSMGCASVLVETGTWEREKAYQDMGWLRPQTSLSWTEGGI